MKVLFWASSDDGSSWYRCVQPAQALGWSGHQARVTQRITNAEVEQADVVVISRPAAPQVLETIPKIKVAGKRVFADLDDDYFAIDRESNPAAFEFWNPTMLAGLHRGLDMCDGVIVASAELRDALTHHLPFLDEAHVIENGLHAAWLARPRDYAPEVITLGWAGSMNTAAWLPQIARAVNLALDTYPNVRFLSVGIPREILHGRYGIKNVPGRVGVVPWAKHGDEYLSTVAQFDIWLAPYADIPFNETKFPTKALEAGMLGIPLVASWNTPYREWDADGDSSFLVGVEYNWTRYVKQLVEDPALRRRIGEGGRARASRNIMQHLGLEWADVLGGTL